MTDQKGTPATGAKHDRNMDTAAPKQGTHQPASGGGQQPPPPPKKR